MTKKDNCDSCYQFGVIATRLADLTKGLSIVFVILTGILGWGGLELYKLNSNLYMNSYLEKRIGVIENGILDKSRSSITRLEDSK